MSIQVVCGRFWDLQNRTRLSMTFDEFISLYARFRMYMPAVLGGIVLLVIGWRLRSKWTSPQCVKCNYDLTGSSSAVSGNCPECGADLTARRAVRYARGVRHWPLLIFATVLMLLPYVLLQGQRGLYAIQNAQKKANAIASGQPLQLSWQSNAQLLESAGLEPESHQVWRELDKRLRAGDLSGKEISQVVGLLIEHMETKRPDGWRDSMRFCDAFLKYASENKLLTNEQKIRFCDIFYGDKLSIRPMRRFRERRKEESSFYSGRSYSLDLGDSYHTPINVVAVSFISGCRIDGKPVEQLFPGFYSGRRSQLTGRIPEALSAGEYTLEVEVTSAYISGDMIGMAFPFGASIDSIPPALKRWTRTARQTFRVYGPDEPMVKSVTSRRFDPKRAGKLKVTKLLALDDKHGRSMIQLTLTHFKTLEVPFSASVFIVHGDHQWKLGQLTIQHEVRSEPRARVLHGHFEDFPRGIATVDVQLIPDLRYLETDPAISQLWDKTLTYKDVPISRHQAGSIIGEVAR